MMQWRSVGCACDHVTNVQAGLSQVAILDSGTVSNSRSARLQEVLACLEPSLNTPVAPDAAALWIRFSGPGGPPRMTRAGLQTVLRHVERGVASSGHALDWAAAARRVRCMS
jgi:hypothetical protein